VEPEVRRAISPGGCKRSAALCARSNGGVTTLAAFLSVFVEKAIACLPDYFDSISKPLMIAVESPERSEDLQRKAWAAGNGKFVRLIGKRKNLWLI
jgi:hypothetical protein